jgi:hypothetical protein
MKLKKIDALVFIGVLVICGASIWQGRYNVDPHHWGLMLSNAKDYLAGQLPYKEIFIQYGFGTTLVQSWALTIYPSLIAILVATAICYAVGIATIQKISYVVTQKQRISLYVFISCVLIHPIVIYPWANYVAFPFVTIGILLILIDDQTKRNLFLGGCSLGIAILCREGLAISMLFIISIYFLYDIYNKKNILIQINKFGIIIAGACAPVFVFLIWLWQNDLIAYWIIYSWELPKAYLDVFPHMSGIHLFDRLFNSLWIGIKALNPAWILITLSITVCFFVALLSLIKANWFSHSVNKLAIAALALLSSALHLTEVFRLATGSILGIVVLYHVLDKLKLATVVFLASSIWLLVNLNTPGSGNYFYPTVALRKDSMAVSDPTIFKGQLWSPEITEYYAHISKDLEKLKELECGVRGHVNNTMDAFLHVLSPFKNYSITPYNTADELLPLRPDIPKMKDKFKNLDVVFFQMAPPGESDNFIWPSGYSLYKVYDTPKMFFIPVNEVLEVFVPTVCLAKISQ